MTDQDDRLRVAGRDGRVSETWRRGYRPPPASQDSLLTPGEVAVKFRVDPKTVTRWAAAGRIGSIRTPGGHRRFRASEVQFLLEDPPR
jgi:excisionase family DNA binding protein